MVREAYKISIHAPLTGSDPVYGGWTCDADDFNPRSPHRERPPGMRYMGAAFDFNPRSPHRERLRRTQRSLWQGGFQSTLPSQGATDLRVGIYTGGSHFNPRSPHRERPCGSSAVIDSCAISIHAPLTGSDDWRMWIYLYDIIISIHAPLTGSDPQLQEMGYSFNISIHAPLTGSDMIVVVQIDGI